MPYQPTQLEYEARRQAIPIPHLRWLIGGMLFLAAILNYIDRQALSILAPTIQKSLGLDDAGYGRVVDLFLIAYTISLLLTGRLVDKLGARWAMAIFITWWSLSNMATGLAVGTAAHGIGTARMLEIDRLAGTVAGLAIGLNGLATTFLLPLLMLLVGG